MKHPKEEILALSAGGDLPFWGAWQVRRHLESCAACRDTRDAYANLRVGLSALPVPELPTNLPASILARVPRHGQPAPARFAPFGAWVAAGALAAAAVLAVLVLPVQPAPAPAVRATNAVPLQIKPSSLSPATDAAAPPTPSAEAAVQSAAAEPVAKFTTVAAAEWDRDRRYLSKFAPSSNNSNAPRRDPLLDQWADKVETQNQNRHLPQVVVGLQAEMLRSHALPSRVEVVALPDSPLQIVSAEALFAEGHLIDPAVEVRNVSSRVVRDYQILWVFRDASGNEFRGRVMSWGATAKPLAPGATAKLSETIVLEAEKKKNPESALTTAKVFLRSATLGNDVRNNSGNNSEAIWVPDRAVLEARHLGEFLPLPVETANLLKEYRRSGVQAFAKLKYQGEEAR